jgi:hypothetical protein
MYSLLQFGVYGFLQDRTAPFIEYAVSSALEQERVSVFVVI